MHFRLCLIPLYTPSKTEYLLNTFHLLNLRVITVFDVCWMIFTSDETVKEEKKLRKPNLVQQFQDLHLKLT